MTPPTLRTRLESALAFDERKADNLSSNYANALEIEQIASPLVVVADVTEGQRIENERIRPILEKLIEVAEAAKNVRDDHILAERVANEINRRSAFIERRKLIALDEALARLREHALAAVGGETPRSGSGVESVEVGRG